MSNITLDRTMYGNLLAEYQPKIITNEDDYKSALESIELLMHREELTPEAISLLKLISTLVEAYEDTLIP